MTHSSDSDSDLSESELEDYIDDIYYRLKKKRYEVKISSSTFRCPFCPRKKKQEYCYNDLLQHAKGVGKSSRGENLKVKGDHVALADYLKKYHSPRESIKADEDSRSDQPRDLEKYSEKSSSWKYHSSGESIKAPEGRSDPPSDLEKNSERSSSRANSENSGKFVWPWLGIVANLPVQEQNGRFVGESGSKLRDEFISKGFCPLKVKPLWNFKGHSGFAVVEFKQDLNGFGNAISFEQFFEYDHHGRRDWYRTRSPGDKLYGWVAREFDYNLSGVVGKYLKQNGILKSIHDYEHEIERMSMSLVSNLEQTKLVKENQCKEMENKLQETCASLNKVIEEKDGMTQAYNEDHNEISSFSGIDQLSELNILVWKNWNH